MIAESTSGCALRSPLEDRIGLDQRLVGPAGDGGAFFDLAHEVGVGTMRQEDGKRHRDNRCAAQPCNSPVDRRGGHHPAGPAAAPLSAAAPSTRALRTWRKLREKTRSRAPVERTSTDW